MTAKSKQQPQDKRSGTSPAPKAKGKEKAPPKRRADDDEEEFDDDLEDD